MKLPEPKGARFARDKRDFGHKRVAAMEWRDRRMAVVGHKTFSYDELQAKLIRRFCRRRGAA